MAKIEGQVVLLVNFSDIPTEEEEYLKSRIIAQGNIPINEVWKKSLSFRTYAVYDLKATLKLLDKANIVIVNNPEDLQRYENTTAEPYRRMIEQIVGRAVMYGKTIQFVNKSTTRIRTSKMQIHSR